MTETTAALSAQWADWHCMGEYPDGYRAEFDALTCAEKALALCIRICPDGYDHAGYDDEVVPALARALASAERDTATPLGIAVAAEFRRRLDTARTEAGDVDDLLDRRVRYLDGDDEALDADEVADLQCGDD